MYVQVRTTVQMLVRMRKEPGVPLGWLVWRAGLGGAMRNVDGAEGVICSWRALKGKLAGYGKSWWVFEHVVLQNSATKV